jgi:hypothetical protein
VAPWGFGPPKGGEPGLMAALTAMAAAATDAGGRE